MNITNFLGRVSVASLATAFFMLLLFVVGLPGTYGETAKPALSVEQARLGERMYREGILPSGQPLQATVKNDAAVPGSTFSCASCHLRSGLGVTDAVVYYPPVNGPSLYGTRKEYTPDQPDFLSIPKMNNLVLAETRHYPNDNLQKSIRTKSYTDKSLAEALRGGIDPSGRTLRDVMPRYLLNDEDMAILISYLKTLSSELSPGASATELHFATIITEDVKPEAVNAMLNPLEHYIDIKNHMTDKDDRSAGGTRFRGMYKGMGPAMRFIYQKMVPPVVPSEVYDDTKLTLSRWVLKGSPATWRAQLEEYYRKEPVFAILGGITGGDWQPVQQFCEDNGIPDLFPITDYPTISQSDWYTFYFSRGYFQEGEGVARFLNDKDELTGKPILQIVRDSREGRALSRGFSQAWQEYGRKPPVTITLKAGEILTAESLRKMTALTDPAAIILWDGPEALKTLEMMAAGKTKPAMVLVSSTYLGESAFSLNQQARGFTYLAYPYGLTAAPGERRKPIVDASKSYNPETNAIPTVRISQQSYIITVILDMALMQMKGNYYRDNLFDQIGMFQDMDLPLYERFIFGTGQRYASSGCYIVQLSTSGKNELIKKTAWMLN